MPKPICLFCGAPTNGRDYCSDCRQEIRDDEPRDEDEMGVDDED